MNDGKILRILLADDHKIVREGLRAILTQENQFEIVGETADGLSTIKLARKLLPDVIVMDVTMPNLNGIDATRQIMSELPAIRIVALSMYFDKHFVGIMLRAGAHGYLRKDCASDELAKAIGVVSRDMYYISPGIGINSPKDILDGSEIPNFIAFSLLSMKEREVLQLVAEGRTTKEIALRLKVSVKMIEKHRAHVMEKLDIRSIAELTKFAIREGLTSLER